MRAHTKKHPTDELVSVVLHVRRSDVPLLRRYAKALEAEEKQNYTVAEMFPEYAGREAQVALRAYRHREGLTQKRLAELTGISQHHISEMENGKRTIGKERARRLADVLHCDYRRLL